jgi:hypothetical protein
MDQIQYFRPSLHLEVDMLEQIFRVLVDLAVEDIMEVVQEILHQHHHHKEIQEELEEVFIMVVVEVVLVLLDNLLAQKVVMVDPVLQSLGYQHLMELLALLQVDTLQVVVGAVFGVLAHMEQQQLVEVLVERQ